MIVHLSLLFAASFLRTVLSCQNDTIADGVIANYRTDGSTEAGDQVSVICNDGFATYTPVITCNADGTWSPSPTCHKVSVRFAESSMIKYVYPIPRDSVDSTISFSFSLPPDQSSGILVRLASKKLADGSRDTLTMELVGGFIATTMQLSSLGQSHIGFCHDDVQLNDNLVHRVVLKRDMTSLSMTIDNRSIQCTYPSSSSTSFTFSSLRSVVIGHMQPAWGAEYGLTGCMTDLSIDGLAPLLLADLVVNGGQESTITTTDIEFVESCGMEYVPDPTVPRPFTTPPPDFTEPVTGMIVDPDDGDAERDGDKTTIIVILVTIFILIILVLVIGIVCKRYYNNKGTYKVDESRLRAEQEAPEQEYFI